MFARTLVSFLLLVGVAVALQPVQNSRRSFVNQLVAGSTAAAVAIASNPNQAFALVDSTNPKPNAYNKKGAPIEKRENTDLNAKQDASAESLLGKMGLAEIPGAADKSTERRKQVTGRKSYSGMKTVFGSV